MAKPDYAHRMTDKELAKLEKRIFQLYKEAKEELDKTVSDYFAKFQKRDEEMKKLVGTIQNGKEWTEQDYINWRLAQIGRGKRFEALRDKIAERMTKANEVALSYVNDSTPGIYTLNRNYAAYVIEQVVGDVGFNLWDEQTVKRLILESPNLMPYYPPEKAIIHGIDLAWGKKQITASITSSILQGKSIKQIADDLQKRIADMNRTSAIRAARTATTGAQNAGRMDSYHAAEKMGIKLKKEWLATLDNRTRHAHAVLDGQQADVDKPFKVDGEEIRFPGDPTAAGYLVYNCRCTMAAVVDGVDTSDAKRRARDQETGESVLIENMTYAQWAEWKKDTKQVESDAKSDIIKEIPKPLEYRQFKSGEVANEFFYYDDEKRGLLAKRNSLYGKWKTGLTADQKAAIDAYTTGGYADLNDFLRKRGDWRNIDADAMTAFRDDLRSCIDGFDVKDPIKVYRYTGEDTFGNVSLGDLVSNEWHDPGFMSTSPTLEGIENAVITGKDIILEISIPSGKGHGAYLNELSPWKDKEYEFLLKDGSTFTIMEVDLSGEKPIVRMVMK